MRRYRLLTVAALLNTRIGLVIAVLLVGTTALAAEPLTATLAVEPATVLPGLPAAFAIRIANVSNQVQEVTAIGLIVTPAAAQPFQAMTVSGHATISIPDGQKEDCSGGAGRLCFSIPALRARQLYIDFSPSLDENFFFADKRLGVPGTYTLQVIVHAVGQTASDVSFASPPTGFIVRTPTGVDSEAWAWLRSLSQNGTWTQANWAMGADAVAAELRARFPTSGYATWVSALGARSNDEQLANLAGALATNPPPGLRDALLLAKGLVEAEENARSIQSLRDLQRALTFADAATATLTLLRDTTISDYLRQRAGTTMEQLYTTKTGAVELEQLASLDSPAPAAIIPRVECVAYVDGQGFTARFGYANVNMGSKAIELGPRNQFTPAPRDQGQPRVFKPGDHPDAVVATSPGGDLIWHLDGNMAVATRSSSPCPAQ